MVLMKIISRLRNSQRIRNYSLKRQVKTGTRATVATMPLLGITWLFGMLTFHTNLIVFKYFFTICNSLQGVFIFIFHCILDRKVSYGWVSFILLKTLTGFHKVRIRTRAGILSGNFTPVQTWSKFNTTRCDLCRDKIAIEIKGWERSPLCLSPMRPGVDAVGLSRCSMWIEIVGSLSCLGRYNFLRASVFFPSAKISFQILIRSFN